MDTIGKIGRIHPCSLEQMLKGRQISNSSVKSSSWEWMFRVLKVAAEHAVEGIVVLDAEGLIRFANEVSAKAHGYNSRANLLGRDLSAFHSDEQMSRQVKASVDETMRIGRWEGKLEHINRNGAVFTSTTRMARVRDDDWEHIGLVIFHAYISDRQQADNLPGNENSPANRRATDFCDKLSRPRSYRYGSDDAQDMDTEDPYLKLRGTNGGPLDTSKLSELAEMLKRLG